MTGVVAVAAPASLPALSRQTRVPDRAFGGIERLERAIATNADWIWLLADGGDPHPDALEQLLDSREPAGEAPASLLAGMAIGNTGCAIDDRLPAGDPHKLDDAVRLTAKRLLPIRHATFTNCLVARECFLAHGVPDGRRFGRYAAVEWTARLLRDDPGYFVPASIVRIDGRVDRRAAVTAIPALARMLRAGVWMRGEAIGEIAAMASALAGSRGE